MATSDKHCQTSVNSENVCDLDEYARVMYDETVVVEASDIDSPNSEEEAVKAMSKFNPPVRHTARHDFDSDSETDSEPEKFLDNVSEEDQVLQVFFCLNMLVGATFSEFFHVLKLVFWIRLIKI